MFSFWLIRSILFNLSKPCYFCANVFNNNDDEQFDMVGVKVNSSNALKYLRPNFIMKKNFFLMDGNDRISKFTAASFYVLLTAEGLCKTLIKIMIVYNI